VGEERNHHPHLIPSSAMPRAENQVWTAKTVDSEYEAR
jgi:hypothetical protein